MNCIDKILSFYKDKDVQEEQEVKVKIGKILIELMEDLKEPERNYLRVRNCLILLINLFLDVESVDRFHMQGKSRDDLSEEETKTLSELLKSEVNNYQEDTKKPNEELN